MTNDNSIKKDIKKLQTNKQFLLIFILLFVSMLFWIIISLIASQTSEKISEELTAISKPLTPVIDREIFDTIENKKEYSPEELSEFTIFKIITSRDGRTQTVVPIEVTIDDLEPKGTDESKKTTKSLLDDIGLQEDSSATDTADFDANQETLDTESDIPNSPAPTESPEPSNLGSQL